MDLDLIQTICSITAICISVFVYYHGLNRERRLDTLNLLSEIRRKYFNTKSLDDKDKLKYLNEMEYFATGINAGIYDIGIVRKMSGRRLIRQYESWANDFITNRRTRSGNNNTYAEYEKMIKNLQRKIKSTNK